MQTDFFSHLIVKMFALGLADFITIVIIKLGRFLLQNKQANLQWFKCFQNII